MLKLFDDSDDRPFTRSVPVIISVWVGCVYEMAVWGLCTGFGVLRETLASCQGKINPRWGDVKFVQQ